LTTQTNINQALKKFESLPQGVSFTDCLVMEFAAYWVVQTIELPEIGSSKGGRRVA
jgi:hypothetical protein